MSDIKIEINNKEINLTFDEGEVLFNRLYDLFETLDSNYNKDLYAWEIEQGIPPVYGILEESFKLDENIDWFKCTDE